MMPFTSELSLTRQDYSVFLNGLLHPSEQTLASRQSFLSDIETNYDIRNGEDRISIRSDRLNSKAIKEILDRRSEAENVLDAGTHSDSIQEKGKVDHSFVFSPKDDCVLVLSGEPRRSFAMNSDDAQLVA